MHTRARAHVYIYIRMLTHMCSFNLEASCKQWRDTSMTSKLIDDVIGRHGKLTYYLTFVTSEHIGRNYGRHRPLSGPH
jgi:hypothetical protein